MGSGARAARRRRSWISAFSPGRRQRPVYFFRAHPLSPGCGGEQLARHGTQTIADLDLNYYLPCTVRGRTIAYLGVSRTETGEFLSSDDVELLVTLAELCRASRSRMRISTARCKLKADEYERLKEFSENIVESINVGILAAGSR